MVAEPPALWTRPYYTPDGRSASVILFVFADRALELTEPLSRGRHGLPKGVAISDLALDRHLRSEAPEWFDAFFTPELMAMARSQMGESAELPDQAQAVYRVQADEADPLELGYLQACWACAKWLCEHGARYVLDSSAIRWWRAEQVIALDSQRTFGITREISIVFENEPTDGFGHVIHTRGLAKFGRPDFVLFGGKETDRERAGVLLNALAAQAALGVTFKPGQTVSATELPPRALQAYQPDQVHPQVHLNNDGLVLQIADWW